MEKKIIFNIKVIYGVFLGVGAIFALIAVILRYQNNFLLSDFFLQLSVSVFSVTIIEIIWRMLGGGPLEQQIQELSQTVPILKKSMGLGLVDIFESRREINIDEILDHLKVAKKVDMMAISLRANWMSNIRFIDILSKKVKRGKCYFRILVLNPSSLIVAQRSKEENDKHGRLKSVIEDSLDKLKKIYDQLDKKEKKFLQIKTLSEYTMYCSIIRIDDIMIVTFYMCSQTGSNCPTMIIRGRTPLFNKFMQEFEKQWNLGKFFGTGS